MSPDEARERVRAMLGWMGRNPTWAKEVEALRIVLEERSKDRRGPAAVDLVRRVND